MSRVESGIINVLKRDVSLRAREIARTLGMSRKEVNHYLYTSLRMWVTQDQQYRWMLKSSLIQEKQLSLLFEMEQEPSSLDELLEQHQQQVRETTLERTLRSLIDFSEE